MDQTLLGVISQSGIGVLAWAVGYFLGRYMQQFLPKPGDGRSPLAGPIAAALWIWHPMFWFFPAAMWARVLEVPLFVILLAAGLLTPLGTVVLFVLLTDLLGSRARSSLVTKLPSLTILVLILVFDGFLLLAGYVISGDLAEITLFIFSTLWAPLVMMVTSLLWSPKIVPGVSQAGKSLAMFLGYFTARPKPVWVVEDGTIKRRIEGNVFRGFGPGYLQTEPENVAVLKKGTKISEVVGPGVILTDAGEMPFQVVDLRNQVRSTWVNAMTRDGILVRAPISSLFRINRGEGEVRLGEPWPYDSGDDVLRVIEAQEVDPGGRNPAEAQAARPWEDLPLAVASHKLKQAISFYSLDQLYQGIEDLEIAKSKGLKDELALLQRHTELQSSFGLRPVQDVADPLVRTTLGKLIRRAVRQALAPLGFDIHGGGIGNKIVPLHREVINQRVIEWKSRFVAKVMDWQAELQSKRVRKTDQTKQLGRETVINAMISDTFEQMAQIESAEQKQVDHQMVAYELLTNLISVAHDPEVQKMLPASTLPTLEDLIHQVEAETGRPQ